MSTRLNAPAAHFLLELHQRSHSDKPDQLIQWMLPPLSALFQAEQVAWSVGAPKENRWWHKHYQNGTATPALQATATTLPQSEPGAGPDFHAGQQHLSARLTISQPLADCHSMVTKLEISRDQSTPLFGTDDAEDLSEVHAHILSAFEQTQRAALAAASPPQMGNRSSDAAAVLSENGLVLTTHGNFRKSLCRQWPQWRGPALPADLISRLQTEQQQRAHLNFSDISLHTRKVGEFLLVYIDPGERDARLTPREREVATLLATGTTLAHAAKTLHCSRENIKTHAAGIYRKLGIRGKAELAAKFAEGGRFL